MIKEIRRSDKFGWLNSLGGAPVEGYSIPLTERKNFLPIPSYLKLKDEDIPDRLEQVDPDVDSLVTDNPQLSKNFRANKLVKFSLNSQGHLYDNKFIYKNLQRLCIEALQPATDFLDIVPTVQVGLVQADNTQGIDPDGIISDFTKGNAAEFNFPNEPDHVAYRVFEYLLEFSLFDRLRFDSATYSKPSIIVSINERRRKLISLRKN